MSTTSAATADSNQSMFRPSWLQTSVAATGAGGNGGTNELVDHSSSKTQSNGTERSAEFSLDNLVFAKYRYGREDMIALSQRDAGPPEGLDNCPFFVSKPQEPIVRTPLTDAESRLQQNINSSKAMSSLSHTDRATIASGGMIGGSGSSAKLGLGDNRTFSPSWATAGNSGIVGRGTGQPPRLSFCSGYRGRGTVPPSTGNSATEISSKYVPSRGGRATGASGRGGANNVQPFNTRAQALYDPRDPRDRPRQRLRSTSDEQNRNDDGFPPSGKTDWMQQANRPVTWNKRTFSGGTSRQNHADFEGGASKTPEWLEDGENDG